MQTKYFFFKCNLDNYVADKITRVALLFIDKNTITLILFIELLHKSKNI